MDYLLILQNGIQYPIDEKTKDRIIKSADAQKSVYVFGSGEAIPLRPFPAIVSRERALLNDADGLAKRKMQRCPKCGKVKQYSSECHCAERSPLQPFVDFDRLPKGAKEAYDLAMSGVKSPELEEPKSAQVSKSAL